MAVNGCYPSPGYAYAENGTAIEANSKDCIKQDQKIRCKKTIYDFKKSA